MDLLGNAIEGEVNAGYSVEQAITFENGVGFAFAHDEQAASPYVTWRTYDNKGKPEYEWGNYFSNKEDALVDYLLRAKNYAVQENVKEAPQQAAELPQLKRLIRFIDSQYREQFAIPDGESIRVTYPPSDGREPAEGVVKFLDETHADIKGNCYHICQWAETMERLGATFEPVNQLQNAIIIPFDAQNNEEKYYSRNREDGNSCAGSLHGNFGNDGERYHASWNERDSGLYTPEIQSEVQSVVYALRQDLLKDRASMLAYCQNHPEAKISEGKGFNQNPYETYGFKLETKKRQYFVNCFVDGKDSRFSIFAYADKPVPLLEQNGERTEQENLKIYHADFNDPDIPNRMEIIAAKNDTDAIMQANDICNEAIGVALVDLNEIDENDNSRQVSITQAPKQAEISPEKAEVTIPKPQEAPEKAVQHKKPNRDAR